MTDLERFQSIKEKVDSYNIKVVEKEAKVTTLKEELTKLEEDMKTLGYNSLEEMQADYDKLHKEVTENLDSMEAGLNAI
jgi:uncharacterized coiled-coil DUF342 family protein